VYSLFEVAILDAQAMRSGGSVSDLLGGKTRDSVDFSAYVLLQVRRAHRWRTDEWGEVLTPDAVVAEAKAMVGRYGFRSIKLKGGVLPPDQEVRGGESAGRMSFAASRCGSIPTVRGRHSLAYA